MKLAFFGSSLVSAYWNGAATYYRGMLKALAKRGFEISFYEPDAYDRKLHRDIPDPPWAKIISYSGSDERGAYRALESAKHADIIVKASGVGVFDDLLAGGVLATRRPHALAVYWDVDAPATLEGLRQDPSQPLRALVPQFDFILTYGGGPPVVADYERLGARRCIPVYNALDPETHYRVPAEPRFDADLAFLANRLPDREARAREFFFKVAGALPDRRFLLGGNGWDDIDLPENIIRLGHVYTKDHNAFNSTPLALLNVARDSMAKVGYSPATRVFEAAGAGACIVTDAWEGIEHFLEPGKEVLVAHDGEQTAQTLKSLDRRLANRIGQAAKRRILAEHTYELRAAQVERLFRS